MPQEKLKYSDLSPSMSLVVGHWILAIQDELPVEIKESMAWESLLNIVRQTDRDREQERLDLVLDWMRRCLKGLENIDEDVAEYSGLAEENAIQFKPETEALNWADTVWAQTASHDAAAAVRCAAKSDPSLWTKHSPIDCLKSLINVTTPTANRQAV
jgi:hypothetical protein